MCLWIQIASHNRIQVQGNLAHGTSHLRVIWCAHGIGACEGQQVSSAPHYALLYARAATKPKVLWAHVWGLCVLTVLLMHVCASVLTCVRRRLCLIECASCERVLTVLMVHVCMCKCVDMCEKATVLDWVCKLWEGIDLCEWGTVCAWLFFVCVCLCEDVNLCERLRGYMHTHLYLKKRRRVCEFSTLSRHSLGWKTAKDKHLTLLPPS